ncbi:hypothetical protein Acy02nite_89070 [Actinoplanes cyaneus]|uniref:GCVT N-terminal domain-containing protein n=1 Tax=Actinoplanes cyaneus TaxID=52696 RepID=A0A919ITK6_9ACTN|nr:aminomethyltransferase family protein [Actinoplanes cyaneus]MCW2144261.1 Glycine cleavage system T protein (aminomethyltransferase) [Actinoplanes cyaneus]GID71026.1 hypothetical protein Acy02nite_89070 [Actinoplanes cyaneus]
MSSAPPTQPWERGPRFSTALHSPLASDEWAWRKLPPAHPALLGTPHALTFRDPGDAFGAFEQRHGEPAGWYVLGGNIVAVTTWKGLSYQEQYAAVTDGAGVFPCGGMLYLSVSGPHAADLLDLLTPRRMQTLAVGQAAFIVFTTPEGTVDTEGVVLRDGEQSYQLSIGGDTQPPTWLHDAIAQFPDTRVEESPLSSFNIKGGNREAAMAALLHDDDAARLASVKPFRGIRVRTRAGADAWVVRTLIGLELWSGADGMREAYQQMAADAGTYTPCGWDVLASFRMECRDFAFYLAPLDIHRGTHLFDAGLGHLVTAAKTGPYIGAEALADPDRHVGRLWVAGLTATDPDHPERQVGDALRHAGSDQPAGYVTSAGWSPREQRQLCFVHLSPAVRPGDRVRFDDGTTWQVSTLPMR